jgi:hypothetical protein
MLEPRAAARGIGRLNAALACLAVLAGCGPVTREAATARQARTGSASSPRAGSPSAKASVKHFDFLNGVSCASPANCVAVGDYYRTASGPQLTLIERWNGAAWRVEPSPSIGPGSTLDSVSCPSATSRTAVGSLIVGWNGVTWKVEMRSSPFASVSCVAPGSCMAVGVTAGDQPARRGTPSPRPT